MHVAKSFTDLGAEVASEQDPFRSETLVGFCLGVLLPHDFPKP